MAKKNVPSPVKLPEGYLNTAEIAQTLGCAQVTVTKWGQAGKPWMQVLTTPGGKRVYCMAVGDVREMAKQARNGPQPAAVG